MTFEETRPISTYLFALAAGRFSIETAERGGRTFRMFHRESDAAKVARNRDAIFDLHAKALTWMESYTGIGYPFGKFDFVLIPAFQFSGMEHPGAIYYNADSLLLDESATQNQHLNRANTISHETAHMWFGDFVTMKWFDDVWMKEVFATFFASKIVNPSFPGVNHPLRFFLQNYPTAYDVDRTEGTNPIRQPLANLAEAGSLYGAIVYQKAPIVMRQLELLLGADILRDGLREYLNTNAFGNQGWTDLVGTLAGRTPGDLRTWSHAWVSEAGRPTITTDLRVSDGKVAYLGLRQSDPAGRGLLWPERLTVVVGGGRSADSIPIVMDKVDTPVEGAVGREQPAWILPTGDGLGYGDFVLDPTSIAALSQSAHTIENPLTRGSAFVALWDSMLDGRLRPPVMRDELLAGLAQETDELLLQWMLDSTRVIFWRFTRDADRPALARRLEPVLRKGLIDSRTTSHKSAWFAAIRSVATSVETVAWLESVWRRDTRIDGLPLSGDRRGRSRVRSCGPRRTGHAEHRGRPTCPLHQRRPSGPLCIHHAGPFGDPTVRGAFFASLRNPRNRVREAWVLDAVRYLHHPLRAVSSAPLVRPALDLLWEIQRTGDIFFPKRWADATLSGYQSAETAARGPDLHRRSSGRLSAKAALGSTGVCRSVVPRRGATMRSRRQHPQLPHHEDSLIHGIPEQEIEGLSLPMACLTVHPEQDGLLGGI